jgi:hypothetical protein
LTTGPTSFLPQQAFHITLPQLLKWKSPRKTIRCAAATKSTLIDDPAHSAQPFKQGQRRHGSSAHIPLKFGSHWSACRNINYQFK